MHFKRYVNEGQSWNNDLVNIMEEIINKFSDVKPSSLKFGYEGASSLYISFRFPQDEREFAGDSDMICKKFYAKTGKNISYNTSGNNFYFGK